MPSIPKTAACVLGLFAVLLALEGCFFFRSKPDSRAQEMTSRLNPGLTTDERSRLKQLERENFELKRANEILRKASAFFAQAELDRKAK